MIAQLLESVKLEQAPAARAALVAIRDHLVGHVLALNQTIDLLDLVTGTSAPAADGDGSSPDAPIDEPRRKKKKRAKSAPAKANGHAKHAGKRTIVARVREVLVDAPAEGWTSDDCAKRLKGLEPRRISITLAGLAKSGEAKKVSYGHYVAA